MRAYLKQRVVGRWLVVSPLMWGLLTACDSKPKEQTPPQVSEAAAAASAALEAAKAAAAEKAARKVIRRAKDDADLVVTPERRAKVEAAVADAKGFLDQRELEQQLHKLELKRGNNEAAIKAFDKLAKGRFVLFTGYIVDPKADGFDLAVRYTPRDPADPVGLTATWFPVHFTNVEGYDLAAYGAGERLAVLARYEGAQRTSQARDLLLLEQWF
jgi:hypothetical protein